MRAARAIGWCAGLSLIGGGLCVYLFALHLGFLRGELWGGVACSAGGVFNCHAVTAGRWGAFLGMPLSLWGLLGYLTVLALSLWGRQSAEATSQALTLISLAAALFVAIDVVLLGVMALVIRFFCLLCLLTYLVNLSLLFVSIRSLEPPWPRALGQAGAALRALMPIRAQPAAWLFWGMVLVGGVSAVGAHAATAFVSRGDLGTLRQQIRQYVSTQQRVRVDTAGDPAFGPAQAPIEIVEFSDFLCPACRRASKLNTVILANHRGEARLVFKHYPLDTACNGHIPRLVHPGACQVAAATECAHLQGTFWPFHDLIFEPEDGEPGAPRASATQLDAQAQRLGLDMTQFRACLSSGQGMEAVKRDVAEGAKVGVTSTPTYVVNGIPMTGGLPPSVFEELVAALRQTK
jgi:protein-disulfide isomerase/uncharacterized membrane protein